MSTSQPGILAPLPLHGRYLTFTIADPARLSDCLRACAQHIDGDHAVLGLGPQLVQALGATVPGLREFQARTAGTIPIPVTPVALWIWLRGRDRGALFRQTRALTTACAPALVLQDVVDGFRYGRGPNGHGRDLSGYEDGTENPDGAAANRAALVARQGAGMNGSSFAAIQQWQHDFNAFDRMTAAEQDAMIGRRRRDNVELDDAPPTAHVRRTAQEDFTPPAFLLRRSMPWTAGERCGLMFVAFGKSLDAFEAQMRRMAGEDDGIVDALFSLSRPLTGAQVWCPPIYRERIDLRLLGLA